MKPFPSRVPKSHGFAKSPKTLFSVIPTKVEEEEKELPPSPFGAHIGHAPGVKTEGRNAASRNRPVVLGQEFFAFEGELTPLSRGLSKFWQRGSSLGSDPCPQDKNALRPHSSNTFIHRGAGPFLCMEDSRGGGSDGLGGFLRAYQKYLVQILQTLCPTIWMDSSLQLTVISFELEMMLDATFRECLKCLNR